MQQDRDVSFDQNRRKYPKDELLAAALRGDIEAENQLFLTASPMVRRKCISIMGHEQDGEDVSQEALLRAHVKMNTFHGRGS